MRPAGRFVAEVLTALKAQVAVGVNLLELDEAAHRMIKDRGAESCYIDYHPSFGASPFGKVLCTSVNDAVLHGLPHDYVIADGDLVSLDFAASVDGWVADSAATGSGGPCTVTRTCPTVDAADVDCRCAPGSSSRSSPGSFRAPTRSTPTLTAGRCAAGTAPGGPIPSTPSPSPKAVLWSSPGSTDPADCGRRERGLAVPGERRKGRRRGVQEGGG